MSHDPTWDTVDALFAELLIEDDPALEATRAEAHAAGLPPHEVTPLQAKLLHLLARAVQARTILEIGTLGAYSTVWLARALPPGGALTTIEKDPGAAAHARGVIEAAGEAGRVELIEGDAHEVLPTLQGPFDLVFIDADKRSNPAYLDHALALSRPGTLILADNVVRDGAVADPGHPDPDAQGVREFARRLGADPRVTATAIQTVGTKGYDGLVVALVTAT